MQDFVHQQYETPESVLKAEPQIPEALDSCPIVRFRTLTGTLRTQTFQNPLIKEYTLNRIRDPTPISGMFLN